MKSTIAAIALFVALALALPHDLQTRRKPLYHFLVSPRLPCMAVTHRADTLVAEVSVETPAMTDGAGNIVEFDPAGVQTGT